MPSKTARDVLAELPDADPLEVGKLRTKLDKLDAELKRERKARETAEKQLADLTAQAELFANLPKPKPRRIKAPAKKPSGQAAAWYLTTDWHSEECIDPGTVNGLNEYNLEIAEARIARGFEKFLLMLGMASHVSRFDELGLWFGGDLVNGYIHEELEETNFLGPAEAADWVQDRAAAGIDLLLRETKLPLRIVCSRGNHGRSTKRKRISTDYKSSWEYLIYRGLERAYRGNSRIEWTHERGYHSILSVHDWRVRFHHGDHLKYYGGVGGLSIPVNKSIAAWNKSIRCDLDVFGHWHQWLVTKHFVSVGCVCGYNAYAASIKAEYQEPSQGFLVIDRERGVTLTDEIFVGKPRERP